MTAEPTSNIRGDERLIFFPTIGHLDATTGEWQLPIHGWIFQPEDDSIRRAAALSLFRRWLGLEPAGAEAELFDRRLRAFLVDNQPHKAVTIRIGGQAYRLAPSTADGHITDLVRLAPDVVSAALARQTAAPATASEIIANTPQALDFDVQMPAGDERTFGGRIHLIGDRGVSVISDIDDTIKVTHVRDRGALLRQTFLRDFEAVPGMAEVYQRWRAGGAAFHYVSRSPWQLYPALSEFLTEHGLPSGTFHMRKFRWKNASTLTPDHDGAKKESVVEAILAALPHRHFIMVGDSGEHDPEIYGALARRYPDQVRGLFIRNTTAEVRQSPRLQQATADIPADRWQLFDRPEELPATIV